MTTGVPIRFGTDGWRGVIADDFTFANVRLVAEAVARCVAMEQPRPSVGVLVAYDTRLLSREFAAEAAEAVAAAGLPVKLAEDFCPTPALSYSVVALGAAAGIMITASHNPPNYSGLKVKAAYGGSAPPAFTARVEQEIERLVASRDQRGAGPPEADGRAAAGSAKGGSGPRGSVQVFQPRKLYRERLAEIVDLGRIGRAGIAVAIDPMYGAGQGLLAPLLREAGCPAEELHAEPNPLFGGMNPEPMPANLGPLSAFLRGWPAEGARFRVGFAFDGDADRIAPVDETGRVLTPHETFALLLHHLVENRGGRGEVVKAFSIGRMVELVAAKYGLPVHVTPVGFKHIAERMRAADALVGGEESGGFGIRGHIPERDGGLVALLILECMAAEGKGLSALLTDLEAEFGPHRYGRMDLTLPSLPLRDAVVGRVRAAPPGELGGQRVLRTEALDGVRLVRADGSWLMLRPSGTEPLLRIYAEARTAAEVKALLAWGKEVADAQR